jgi:PAS domain S-box-containing protein
LDLQAVVVGRGGASISLVDRSGFIVIHLTWPPGDGLPGDKVRLRGDVEFVNGKPLLMHPELTVLGRVPTASSAQAGQPLEVSQNYVLGAIEGDAEFLAQDSDYSTIRLTSSDGTNLVLARILNPNRRQLPNPLNCRLRVRGVVESVTYGNGRPIPGIVWVSRLSDVALLAPRATDWNSRPAYSIGDMIGTNFIPPGLVRLTGTVDQDAGEYQILKEGTNRIAVYIGEGSALPLHSRVEAMGFLGRESNRTILGWAVCRPGGEKTKPSEMAIDAEHPVTEIGEVNRLRHTKPDLGFPMRLRGVVTYICGSYIADENNFYLQDGTNAIKLLNATAAGLTDAIQQEGMYVEITGQNSHDGITPTGFVKFLGKGRMPEPIRSSFDALMSAENAGRWAQVEGVVSGYNGGRLTLLVEGKELTVWVNQITLDDHCRAPGSRLRVSGVCEPIVNARDQMLGSRLLVPSSECIEIIAPGPADPFLLPKVAIASILLSSPGVPGDQMQMVRSEGIVTYKGPQMLCLQDKDSGMRVFLQRESTDIKPGDFVQVAGLALPDGFSPKLVQALVLKAGRGNLPAANVADFLQAYMQSDQDATRGQVDAIFEGQGASDSAPKLELLCEATQRNFYAYLPAAAPLPTSLLPGSRVRLRGVIKLQPEEALDANQVVTAFEMYLNSPADIQVLKAPSWWTARHTLWLVGGLGSVLIVSLGWISALRRQVRQQTRALEQENAERKQAQAELAASNTALQKENLERQHAEEVLRSQEERTRMIIDQAFDAVVTADIDFRIIGWNLAAEKTLGWTCAEILGRNLLETIVPSGRREKRRADLEQFRATGEWPDLNCLVHTTAMHRDGRELPIELTFTPIRLGHHCIFTLFLRDITERQQAEAALAHERHLLESLLDSSVDCIYFKDRDSRILRCSKSQSQRFCGGAADLMGKTDFDLFTEDHARPAFEDEQEIIRTGRPLISKVERERAKDGRESWALTSKMPLRNRAGEIVGTFGISKDITKLKQAELSAVAFAKLGQDLFSAASVEIASQMVAEVAYELFNCDAFGLYVYVPETDEAQVVLESDTIDGQRTFVTQKGRDRPSSNLRRVLKVGPELILKDALDPNSTPFGDKSHPSACIMRVPLRVLAKSIGVLAAHSYTPRAYDANDLNFLQTLADYCSGSFERIWREENVRELHKQLLETSRQAGMAEVATSVLHNVGNVLNSINVSVTMVDERVRKSRVSDVGRLAKLLEEHAEDRAAFLSHHPKGKKVPDFIGRLAEQLGSEQAAMLEEISSLRQNVEHVKEIIAMQQSYARVSGVFENIKVTDLLEDSLRMNEGSLARHDVKVVRDFNDLRPICSDRHKVLQILINLLRNAKYACDESGRDDKQIILRATNGGDRVKIAVIDNGVGIPMENLTRIFNHGFTTRKDGHGFGLHSGALAAKDLGGSLNVHSDGLGLGAVFTLELPCQPPSDIETKIAHDHSQDAGALPKQSHAR